LTAGQRTFADDFPFVGGKAGQQGEHQASAGGSGIEILGKALSAIVLAEAVQVPLPVRSERRAPVALLAVAPAIRQHEVVR
jgi:hypothetical protein